MTESKPVVSVIIPVYNTADYLPECLDSILQQTLSKIEVICVNDGSTDHSLEILDQYREKDSRIRVFSQPNSGAGAARNYGLAQVQGTYTYFLDSDDYCKTTLLEQCVAKLEENGADFVAFQYLRQYENEQVKSQGIHPEWINGRKETFQRCDVCAHYLRLLHPAPWTKVFRTDFLQKNHLKFDEIGLGEDISFTAVALAYAEKITWIPEELMVYRANRSGSIMTSSPKNPFDYVAALDSTRNRIQVLSYFSELKTPLYELELEKLSYFIQRFELDWATKEAEQFYRCIQQRFLSEQYADLAEDAINDHNLWTFFQLFRSTDYETFLDLIQKKIIVSLTSYPGRIPYIYPCLDSILSQSYAADQYILWLSREEFPKEKEQLPQQLLDYEPKGLTIRFVDGNLKPHKKYFYAFQEFPDDIVITFDDDQIYSPTCIESLYHSCLRFPNAVSALRTHLMTVHDDGSLKPYTQWIMETDGAVLTPSMQLFATGVSGVLYPPHLLPEEMLNEDAILSCCLTADDLWLKAAELYAGVPVVLANKNTPLQTIADSQEEALWYANVKSNENDTQWAEIASYYDVKEKGILLKQFHNRAIGTSILSAEEVTAHMLQLLENKKAEKSELNTKLKNTYREKSALNAKLKKTYQEKSELNAKIQQTYQEKSELNTKLQQTYQEKSELNTKLQQTYQEKSELNAKLQQTYQEKSTLTEKLQQTYQEKAERGARIKELEQKSKELEQKNAELEQKLKDIQNSKAYKLGTQLAQPIRKIRGNQ